MDKNKRVCIRLGGVIAGNYSSCEEKRILFFLRKTIFYFVCYFMNMEIATIFEMVKSR